MQARRLVETYSELISWYDGRFQKSGTWPTSSEYAQNLLDILRKAGHGDFRDANLLDVACGGGYFIKHAGKAFRFVVGCDISRAALCEAYQHSPSSLVVQANAESLPFADAHFDYVTCLGSLEHFLAPGRALLEMQRVIKPNGSLLILVPTHPDWATYGEQPTEIVMEPDEWETYFRWCGFETFMRVVANDYESLRSASAGSHVYCLRIAQSDLSTVM